MKAKLSIYCDGCEKHLGQITVDTADLPEQLQEKLNKQILIHRKDCRVYRVKEAENWSSTIF